MLPNEQIEISPFTLAKGVIDEFLAWEEGEGENVTDLSFTSYALWLWVKKIDGYEKMSSSSWIKTVEAHCICISLIQCKAVQDLQLLQILVAPQTGRTHRPDKPDSLRIWCVAFWRGKKTLRRSVCFPLIHMLKCLWEDWQNMRQFQNHWSAVTEAGCFPRH